MGMVDVTINGRLHQVQCGDGEEARLKRLAAYVDGCAAKLIQQHGTLPEAKMLLLASITVADELADAYDEVKRLRSALADSAKQSDQASAAALDRVATRLEQLAGALDRA
jgi:cell division protein ZapA